MQDSPAGGQNLKTIYKKRWTENAVSPVIATILMVAITVVLAAVLYLLVSGLIGGGGASEPQINLSNGDPLDVGKWKVEVAGASTGETLASYNVALTRNDTIAIASQTLDGLSATCSGTPGISFSDVQADGKLNAGDWFTVCGGDSTSDYQVQLFWKNTGNKVSGNTGKINQ